MVLSREHAKILNPPSGQFPGYDLLWDQGWLNFSAARESVPFQDIGFKFNHTFLWPGDRLESFIIHHCGTANGAGYASEISPGGNYLELINSDMEKWRKRRASSPDTGSVEQGPERTC